MVCHGCRLAVFPVWFLWLAICSSGVGSEPEGNAVKHKPPELKPVRWQQLEKCYQDVFIDGSGRAWFFCTTPRYTERPKWAYLVCPELPDKAIQMPGTNVPLGFDGRNRFWEVGKLGLCCTDVHHDTFFQRRLVGPDKLRDRSDSNREQFLPFVRLMFEHSSGRLYFLDSNGVHVLDGEKWSYRELSPPLPSIDRSRQAPVPGMRMIEGTRGEVYLWSPLNYIDGGLWIHDGADWKYYTSNDNAALRVIGDVAPQPDGTIRVQNLLGHQMAVTLPGRTPQPPLENQADPRRDARNARFWHWWNTQVLADITGEELGAYGDFLAKDAQGRVYCFTVPAPVGYGPVAVFDPRHKDNSPTLKYECLRLDRTGFRRVGFDSQRRLWTRLSVKDQPFLSRYEGGGWTHFPDPTGWTPDRYPDRMLIWKNDMAWMMILRKEYEQHNSANVQGASLALPGMANPGVLQPLRNDGLVAVEPGIRVFLFDGQRWKVYDSLRKLVEDNYAWLKEYIDNAVEQCSYDGNPTILGRDATGHVWSTEYEYSGAYDGKSWSEIPTGGFRMNRAGDRAVAGGILHDSSVWPPKGLTSLPNQRGSAWFDRRGSVWATGDNPYLIYRSDGDRFVKVEVSSKSLPLLEDSAGRYWLSQSDGWKLLYPNGQTSEQCPHPVTMHAPVIEQGRGIFWAFASDGLLRLHVEEPKGGKPKIVIDKLYPRLIPQGEIAFLGLDRHNNLWLATQSGKSGLYRIELPPLEGARP